MSKFILKQKGIPDSQDEIDARNCIQPGMILYGYCCGYFGRDSYANKKIISIDGREITVRDENGVISTSYKITSWVDLVESSNKDMEQL